MGKSFAAMSMDGIIDSVCLFTMSFYFEFWAVPWHLLSPPSSFGISIFL